MRAAFAVPGDLAAPTGGYGYARRLLREAAGVGLDLVHVPLPDGFPLPDAMALGDAEERLRAVPADMPVLIDGLALGAMPGRLLRDLGLAVVALCHHPLAMETGLAPDLAQHLRRTERLALGACQHVITTSHATATILTREYDVPGARLTVAPPGTDPAPRVPQRDAGPCRVLSVGSVTPRKGHDRLVRALARHRDLAWTLRIVGAERDAAASAALRTAIAECGLEDRVEVAGTLSTPALTAAYQGADLFVLASDYEGFGMAFTEAMAHGLPAVGLDGAAVAEATAGAALLVAPTELSAALGPLIADTARRQALADKCWTAAQTFLRWPGTAAIVAGVLRKAVT